MAIALSWMMIAPPLPPIQVAAQERSTSVGSGKAESSGMPATGGRGRGGSGSRASRPLAIPCPSEHLPPKVALPAEQLTTITFMSPKLDAKGAVADQVTREAKLFVEPLNEQIKLELAAVPGGCFSMGSTATGEENERPAIRARVFGFYMGRTEITQAQWRVVALWPKIKQDLPLSPSKFTGDDLPVDSITWDEAVEFCRRLTKKTGRPYRLPTEAEWEYACRAGTTEMFAYGPVLSPDFENYDSSLPYDAEPVVPARKAPTPAGSLGFNAFGLADMHGNVREWCLDAYTSRLTNTHAQGAPVRSQRQDEEGQRRTIRGGYWGALPDTCRCSSRDSLHREELLTTLGFRVVLSDRYREERPTELDDDATERHAGFRRLSRQIATPVFSRRVAHLRP
ncbi:MAG: formylglycine-generating enzyme family protein [Acidobacteriota bacterium]